MSKLKPDDIISHVEKVLLKANTGKWNRTNFMTVYQILDRLPKSTRQQLIQEHGEPGKGSGKSHSAAGIVSKAARKLSNIVEEWMDSGGITIKVAGRDRQPGYGVTEIYRLRLPNEGK